ncbi:hypothetical protein BD408DRAFT_411908 [Parasitella parasitica]|nr:hypothetical protein BD408DRAFT_411908 [Parasitella parasitica]
MFTFFLDTLRLSRSQVYHHLHLQFWRISLSFHQTPLKNRCLLYLLLLSLLVSFQIGCSMDIKKSEKRKKGEQSLTKYHDIHTFV